MPRETITIRIQPRVRKALDGIATALDLDRTYVFNQAIEAYIDLHQWQIDHIRQGLREASAGTFATEAKVNRTIARLRKSKLLTMTVR
jgi:RHH-type transcriptional regulator, rel operon repressor / antitoxin RelB